MPYSDNNSILRLSQIEQFPQVRLTNDDIHSSCSICISAFTKDEIVMILPCVHKFHRNCIQPWLNKQSTCPTCREKVLQDVEDLTDDTNDENSDSEIAEDNSLLAYYPMIVGLVNSYFNPTDDSMDDTDFSDAAHSVADGSTASSLTLEMDADSSDTSIAISDGSSDESVNISSESQSNDSSSSESSNENDNNSDVVFPDTDDSSDTWGMSENDSSD